MKMYYGLYRICDVEADDALDCPATRYVELVALYRYENDLPGAAVDSFIVNLETGEVIT